MLPTVDGQINLQSMTFSFCSRIPALKLKLSSLRRKEAPPLLTPVCSARPPPTFSCPARHRYQHAYARIHFRFGGATDTVDVVPPPRRLCGSSCNKFCSKSILERELGVAMRLVPVLRASALGWREQFDFKGRDVAHWFPKHMAKGMRDMKARLRAVDCLLEVHDARIPLTGRSSLLKEALDIRPHVLVLNKMDLADLSHKPRILECLQQQGLKHVIFTDCLKDENVNEIVPLVTELISNSPRYHRAENVESCIMVIGAPNVGKSSLINSLRRLYLKKGKASPVGGKPGITKAVLNKIQVCERPIMFLLDTPGVLSPRIESVETGLKLALCGAIQDHLVGEDVIADYLLFTLNRQQQFRYVEHYGLDSPCDDVERVLKSIALHLGKTHKVRVLTGTGNVTVTAPNYNAAASDFIYIFRRGLLGKVIFD
uniref:Mitochondrial ribosome-associated GTPase 1 n=1 Tax=Salvator merianae TaxID=96440 RepID=A0A8D0DIJ8_SALMN